MKNLINKVPVILFCFCLSSINFNFKINTAQAQVSLINYNSYLQNFNSLTGSTTPSYFLNNATATGWYLQHETYNLAAYGISANDGTNTTRNFYSLGNFGSSDRALGGMATDVNTGSGYIGFRVRNNTGATIRNFEITYAMEQWYNSGNEAKFDFSYTTKSPGTAITSLLEHSATWISIDDLDAITPSITSPIGAKNGNADAHRIVKMFTINEINLLPNQEIMLRWQYITVNATNGNGLALDDVTITPQINVFYAANSGDFDSKSTWARNQNGSGGNPTDFSLPNQVFYITKGSNRPLKGSMNMTGSNSKIVLGDGINPIDIIINASSSFTGRIDVENNATLTIENATAPLLGSLAGNSTVVYSNDNPNHTQLIESKVFGNIRFSGKSKKALATNILVNGNLILDGSIVELRNFDMALQKQKIIQGGSETSYIKTNGTGKLILTVPRTDIEILFPVGNATYNPIVLLQSHEGAEDEFRVSVIDGIYMSYDQYDQPTGNALTQKVINRTWLIEEGTKGGSDMTMKLFWYSVAELPDFFSETAYISHYENNQWDVVPFQSAQTENGLSYISRSNIKSFSPYGIMSEESSLPVSILDFSISIINEDILLEWKTSAERNNDFFTVESSTDAKSFLTIGQIKGLENSNSIANYSFIDTRRITNDRYYRLKQTNFDKKSTYSNVILVKAPAKKISLYPIPSKDEVNIQNFPEDPEYVEIIIMDIHGKIFPTPPPVHHTANHIKIDIASLPPNTYLLEIKSVENRTVTKFIKM